MSDKDYIEASNVEQYEIWPEWVKRTGYRINQDAPVCATCEFCTWDAWADARGHCAKAAHLEEAEGDEVLLFYGCNDWEKKKRKRKGRRSNAVPADQTTDA